MPCSKNGSEATPKQQVTPDEAAMRAADYLLLHLPVDPRNITAEHRLVVSQIIARETKCVEMRKALERLYRVARWSKDTRTPTPAPLVEALCKAEEALGLE